MSINKLKGLLVALALCVAPASMASVLPAFDGELTVGVGNTNEFFAGYVNADEAFDYWKINIEGTGTTTAAAAIFGGVGEMHLFNWDSGTNTLGSLIASAVQAVLPPELGGGLGYSLSAFLNSGSYVLQIAGVAGGSSYAGQISAVPLPGAALLFGSALFGAGMIGRKKLGARKIEAVAA